MPTWQERPDADKERFGARATTKTPSAPTDQRPPRSPQQQAQAQLGAIIMLVLVGIVVVVILAALAPADHPTGKDFAPPVHRAVSLAKVLATGASNPCPGSTPVAANEAYRSVYVVCADGVTAAP